MITHVLSGPMRGIPNYNYPLFHEVEKALSYYLTADGAVSHDGSWQILNPARNFDGDLSRPLADYMKASLAMVLKSDVVVLLPNWQESEGALCEVNAGRMTGTRFWAAIPSGVAENGWLFEEINVVDALDKLATPAEKLVTSDTKTVQGRTFEGGAYRDTEDGKLNYEGFLSPLVLYAYAEYMHRHRVQSDGKIRSADNWQKGMPLNVYMESMWRHFMDVWMAHRNVPLGTPPQMEALMALLFNVMGYAYELLKQPEGF